MKLQYFGHSCFRIISEMGMTIVCDPYKSSMVGIQMVQARCDVVTVSHHHDDHDCMENVLGNPAILDVAGSCLADDVEITAIESFHDDQKGKLRGKNLVFKFVVDGISVVHLGDIGCTDDGLVEKIGNCDVLLLPVGGTYTVDHEGAYWYAQQTNAKIVVPMHYHTDKHNFVIDGVEKFLAHYNADDVTTLAYSTLNLDDAPQNEKAKVIVLEAMQD